MRSEQGGPYSPAASSYLDRWLAHFVATRGLTALEDLSDARALHVDDALTATSLLRAGSLVDVGSGGGSPGIPLAVACPTLSVTLLESNRRKADFLEQWAAELDNATVVRQRAEDYAAREGFERFDNATARALAPPAVALEWVLPLVRTGGRFILYTTRQHEATVTSVAPLVAGQLVETLRPDTTSDRILCLVEKTASTPARFPRRSGIAKKRPLAPPDPPARPALADRDAP